MEEYKLSFPQAKVYPIFPIGIMDFPYENGIEEISYHLKTLQLKDGGNGFGKTSVDTYVLDHPELKPLKQFIESAFLDYAKVVDRVQTSKIQLLQSWISVKLQGQVHQTHQHSNSLYSGVFYFDDYNENSPPIYFCKETLNQHHSALRPLREQDYQEHTFSQEIYYYPPRKNSFIVFPSWLRHGVLANQSKKPRVSLSVNCITDGSFGDEINLSGINYERLTK